VAAKRLWLDQKKKKHKEYASEQETLDIQLNKKVDTQDIEAFDLLIKAENEAEVSKDHQQKLNLFKKAFEKLGEQCRQLLKQRYSYGIATKEIAEHFGFKSNRVAITSISRCKQKVIKFYQEALGK